ncbi:MAG: nuclear transport factor 2 family protein [Novosphingobium sp.]|nr:nuclear transport factor 2 family protein [Novosphingobium sp.]
MTSDTRCRCADLEAIRRLHSDYGRLLDARDAEGWAALFAPEGSWIGGEAYGVISGRAELAAFIRREFSAAPPCAHMLGNAAIMPSADGTWATAWSRWLLLEQDGRGMRPALCGSYADRLVRLPDGWRFERRDVTLDLPRQA